MPYLEDTLAFCGLAEGNLKDEMTPVGPDPNNILKLHFLRRLCCDIPTGNNPIGRVELDPAALPCCRPKATPPG